MAVSLLVGRWVGGGDAYECVGYRTPTTAAVAVPALGLTDSPFAFCGRPPVLRTIRTMMSIAWRGVSVDRGHPGIRSTFDFDSIKSSAKASVSVVSIRYWLSFQSEKKLRKPA